MTAMLDLLYVPIKNHVHLAHLVGRLQHLVLVHVFVHKENMYKTPWVVLVVVHQLAQIALLASIRMRMAKRVAKVIAMLDLL